MWLNAFLSLELCIVLWAWETMAYMNHPFQFESNETRKYVDADGNHIKTDTSNGLIPGCGPLPKTGGLSWETRSGRPVQENSTVYEEYFPHCPQGEALNSDIRSIRCWETLRWDVHPGNLHCTDPPFPKIYIIAICAAIGGLGLIGGGICIGVLIYRKRRSPPSDNSDPEANKELEEFTYTAPTAQPSDQEKFIAMTVVKQEEAS
ncbi:uncharacterized protein LOC111126224 [Crassostrea virginica]